MAVTIDTAIPAYAEKKPGSREALDSGCLCPAEENCYGKGCIGGSLNNPIFAVNKDCPLHGRKQKRRR